MRFFVLFFFYSIVDSYFMKVYVYMFILKVELISFFRITKEAKDCKPFSCILLTIKCLDETDSGNYSCRVKGTDQSEVESETSFTLLVHGTSLM